MPITSTTASAAAARRAAAVCMILKVLLLVVNALWLGFLAVAFATTRDENGPIGPGETLLLASTVLVVLLLPTLAVLDFRRRDDLSNRLWPHARNICIALIALLQYGAAIAFTVTISDVCSASDNKEIVMDKCNMPLRAGAWIIPTLMFLFFLYLVAQTHKHRARPQDNEADAVRPVSRNGTSTTLVGNGPAGKSIFDSLGFGSKSEQMQPPAPAYAYAAAGAVRRWSQSMLVKASSAPRW